MSTTAKKNNPIQWATRYVKEAREELKKVTWPSQKETTKYSIIVIVLSLLVAAYFAGADWILNKGLEALISITS